MKPRHSVRSKHKPNLIGKKGEDNLQKTVGGLLTPGSRGGDLKCDDFLIEKKTTEKNSISVKKDYLEKIERIAFENNKIPALVIEFEALKRSFCPRQWAIVPIEILLEYLELKKNL